QGREREVQRAPGERGGARADGPLRGPGRLQPPLTSPFTAESAEGRRGRRGTRIRAGRSSGEHAVGEGRRSPKASVNPYICSLRSLRFSASSGVKEDAGRTEAATPLPRRLS